MNSIVIYTILALVLVGVVSAILLYLTAKKFYVYEDPRIDEVEKSLPGANCGGCGFAGCRNFAESLVKEDDISALYCPVGGKETMDPIATYLGKAIVAKNPTVAVIRCNGTPEHRPYLNKYDGAPSCAIASSLYTGETGCPNGCLGLGDCVVVCDFDAIHMDPVTKLPVVDDAKCTACGACVKACPRMIIELRKKNPKDRKIYVSCINVEKGAIARKNCAVACIGCSKCFNVCPYEAITMNNNLAFIDSEKCRLCRKCVTECPTSAILELNFPPRKDKTEPATTENTIA